MRNNEINSDILSLWKKYYSDTSKVYAPIFYDDFTKDSILFVGCNPSFSKKAFPKILSGHKYENIDKLINFLKWDNFSKDIKNVDESISLEKLSIEKYAYFKPLKDIADKIKLPFEHIDLFLYRQTNQADFKMHIFENGKINKFGIDQIDLFKKIVSYIQPKVIVVANAFASQTIKEQLKDLIKPFDEEKGVNFFIINNKKVPIFFTSMITGQRALDNNSKERLIWHIKQVINSF